MASSKITPRVYDAAKLLQESGSTQVEVGRYLKIGKVAVGLIFKSETYEEYQALMYENGEAWRKKRAAEAKKAAAQKAAEQVGAVPASNITPLPAPKPISMTIQATHYMETKLDQVIDLLKIMNNKLGAIIDDLYGTGKGADAK